MYSCTLYMPKWSKRKRKGLLAWLATLQWLQHTCTCFRMTVLFILGAGYRLWDFWHIPYLPTSFPGFSPTHPYGARERERPWLGLVIVSRAGLSESFEVDGWVVNVSSQRWRGKPLGGSRGMLPEKIFIFRRSEMLFAALSRDFFSQVTGNLKWIIGWMILLHVGINFLISSFWSFLKVNSILIYLFIINIIMWVNINLQISKCRNQ